MLEFAFGHDIVSEPKSLFQLRPFKILSVKNTETNTDVSERDAIKQGVIDDNRVTYTDKTTGKQVLIADAIRVYT